MNKKQQDRLEAIVEKMVATAATDLLLQVCAFLCKKADFWVFSYMSRFTALATLPSLIIRSFRRSGEMDCAPSEAACSGSGWHSRISPSAPAATADRHMEGTI